MTTSPGQTHLPVIKADFHIHTHFSPDSKTSPERLVARCLEIGLSCIAVTDHHTIQGAVEVQKLAPFFKVIIGEEVKSTGGDIIGLFLLETIPSGLSPEETVQRIKNQGGLVSIPHPFDQFRRSALHGEALLQVLPYADLIEAFNARTTLRRDSQRAQELASKSGLPGLAVSDAHITWELGRTYVELPAYDGSRDGLKEAVSRGNLVTRSVTPLVHLLTRYTVLTKRLFR